ncbi:hypothetical protein K2X85_20015 [bacterium]|nr:hypothetical protein [bacterium]
MHRSASLLEGVACWGIIFASLVLWRWETLTLSPYEDQAVGYWNEADYLSQHHFDYRRFLFQEPNFMDETPGRRSYGISILSPLLAAVQCLIPTTSTRLIVWHLLSFALTAWTVTMLAGWLIPSTGRLIAYLTAIALLTTPSFLVQGEIMGMDVPVTTAMVGSAILATRERYRSAIGLSALAFAFKATGMMMTLALITYFASMLLLDPRTRSEGRPRYIHLLASSLFLLGIQGLLEFLFDTSVSALVGLRWFPVMRPLMALQTAPDVVIILVGVIAGSALLIVGSMIRASGYRIGSLQEWCWNRRSFLLSWILVAGFVAAVGVHVYVPRYIVPALPFLFYLMGWLIKSSGSLARVGCPALFVLTIVNLVNAEGRFYPTIDQASLSFIEKWPNLDKRSCVFTERSREYLADLRSNKDLCHAIEQGYRDHLIIAPEPFYSYLTLPALGYVSTPLNVRLVANASQTIEMLARCRAEFDTRGPSPIVIWKRSARSLLPDRSAHDLVVFQDDLDPRLEAYVWRSFDELPSDVRSLMVWYIPRTRRPALIELSRIDLFMRTGRIEFARRELEAWKETLPSLGLLDEMLRKVDQAAQSGEDWTKVRSSFQVLE